MVVCRPIGPMAQGPMAPTKIFILKIHPKQGGCYPNFFLLSLLSLLSGGLLGLLGLVGLLGLLPNSCSEGATPTNQE